MKRLLLAAAVLALAACTTAHSAPTGTTDGSPFTCSTVVDSGDPASPFQPARAGSLTAQQAIAYLEALVTASGTSLSAGNVTGTAVMVLGAAKEDLENYHLDKLANDAGRFAEDEYAYDPSGPVDTSRWPAVRGDIAALGKDCPGAAREASGITLGGS